MTASEAKSVYKDHWKQVAKSMAIYGQASISLTPDTLGLIEPPTGCAHRWRQYVGFREAYEFCETCDEKRAHEK